MPRFEVIPVPMDAEVEEGADLAALVVAALDRAGLELEDGDVLCVASKVVAKAEGAWIDLLGADHDDPDALRVARRNAARERAARIVADTPQVLITQTPHGFVCANGGIDASNVPDGRGLDLPDDPDASATDLRTRLRDATGIDVGVVVTDTFGRPWREGQVDVALGVAGMAAVRDERGNHDRQGHPLEVTVVALADQVASAADLARTKADGTPVVLVRGLGSAVSGDGTGQDLVRAPDLDLFRWGGPTAAEQAVAARRTVRSFLPDPVDPEVLARAVAAAVTAPAPHHTRPWRFVRLTTPTRHRLLDAMADRWRSDLAGDGVDADRIERRIARSDAILRNAPELLVPFVELAGSHEYPDAVRSGAERDMFLLAGGAGLANLQVVLAAHGFGTAWISSTLFCADVVRRELALDDDWHPLGMVAIGRRSADAPGPRPPIPIDEHLLER